MDTILVVGLRSTISMDTILVVGLKPAKRLDIRGNGLAREARLA
jgi:hypothetical protein